MVIGKKLTTGRCHGIRGHLNGTRLIAILAAGALLIAGSTAGALAQARRITQRYPARPDVRLELNNLFGTVTVEAWDRNEVKVVATLEAPTARFAPERREDALVIDIVATNHGRGEVGDVNFRIYVPVNSTVDISTRRGNIAVNGVRGAFVRAHVSLGGDIDLTDIRASRVLAENNMGNILFDGELASGGEYELRSREGTINIRIPADSAFHLEALAPTRSIELGVFASDHFRFVSDNRKVIGRVGGDGSASLTVTNWRGRIFFLQR